MNKDIFLERADAKSRLFRATNREASSHGPGLLLARITLRLAEGHFNRVERLYNQSSPADTPIPGTIIDQALEGGSVRFGLVQDNSRVENFSVPHRPLVPPPKLER